MTEEYASCARLPGVRTTTAGDRYHGRGRVFRHRDGLRPTCATRKRSSRPDVERGHLAEIANEQPAVRNHRMIPRLAGDRGEPRLLLETLRRRLHERHVAVFGQHHQTIPGQEDLAVSVPPAFPFQ